MKILKGMTWDHPRGYLPLDACSQAFYKKFGIKIIWERRSLQDFETYPVELIAKEFDLIVIDHPHVGNIAESGSILPLGNQGRSNAFAEIKKGSVGPSFESYFWRGQQWAFPIDAATQVAASVPSKISDLPTNWSQVIELARDGRVAIPLKPPHSLMVFYTLLANLGAPCDENKLEFFSLNSVHLVFEMVKELISYVDQNCFEMDPINVLEQMASANNIISYSPLIYGYINYAFDGFRERVVAFSDIISCGENGPVGAALGGTGIAVSAFSKLAVEAMEFAYFTASGVNQRLVYGPSHGQVGHLEAWTDSALDKVANGFYSSTTQTLTNSFLRPRHNGYMKFQSDASERINEMLRARKSTGFHELNELFQNSKFAI